MAHEQGIEYTIIIMASTIEQNENENDTNYTTFVWMAWDFVLNTVCAHICERNENQQ